MLCLGVRGCVVGRGFALHMTVCHRLLRRLHGCRWLGGWCRFGGGWFCGGGWLRCHWCGRIGFHRLFLHLGRLFCLNWRRCSVAALSERFEACFLFRSAVPTLIVHAVEHAKLVAMLLEVADNLWQCRDGGALCAGVVHQKALNVVSRATSRAHKSVGSNVVAARIARIKVPVHKLIAAVEQSHAQAVHKFRVGIVFAVNRVTATAGETHDARTLAGVFLNQVVEFVEVGKVGVDAFIDFEIVRIGVDSHLMAVFGNGCHAVEVGGELGSDEECGFHPLLAQNVQYLVGAHRWTVVESEIYDFLVFAHHTE